MPARLQTEGAAIPLRCSQGGRFLYSQPGHLYTTGGRHLLRMPTSGIIAQLAWRLRPGNHICEAIALVVATEGFCIKGTAHQRAASGPRWSGWYPLTLLDSIPRDSKLVK